MHTQKDILTHAYAKLNVSFMDDICINTMCMDMCACVSVCVGTHKDMRVYEILTLTFVPAHAHHAHGRIHACTHENEYKCMCVSACEGRNEVRVCV